MTKSIWSIMLSVFSLKKAVVFYKKTVRLGRKFEYSSYADFQCSEVEIGLVSSRKEKRCMEDAPSVEFFVNDVGTVYEAVGKKGVILVKEPHDEPWEGRKASFLDSHGNLLEIMQIGWKK